MRCLLGWFSENKDALAGLASVFSILGAVFTVIIFFFGLRQYSKAENWKKTEYIARLFSDFSNDPGAVRAIWMIDGDDRKIFFEEGDTQKGYPVTQRTVIDALREYSPGKEFSPVELHIRDSFDVFFSYIQQVDRAIENGLIDKEEVHPYFAYWVRLFNNPSEEQGQEHLRAQMLNYIEVIGYVHVQRFLSRWPQKSIQR